MSGARIRILVIEDNPGDARLIKEMLLESGSHDMEMEWESSLVSGLSRLRKGGISAVLLDLDLPDAVGLETLAEVYQQFPEIPIIVLTGQGDEEVAVHAVKRGAQDYLVKDAVDEMLLVRSIRYALERKRLELDLVEARDELEKRVEERTSEILMANRQLQQQIAERRRATEALKESEQRLRAIFEGAQDLIFLKDLSLRYTHVNPAMERLLGLPAKQILGKTASDLYSKQAAAYIREVDTRVLGGEWIEEVQERRIKGVAMTFHDVRVPMRDAAGNIVGLCGFSRDVTDRNRREVAPSAGPREYPSEAMSATLKKARYAASSDSVILLTGESGAGKDYLAKYIHDRSRRASGPYFSINCAAVAPDLAESELFGHERGAFTGAHSRKRGLLELAEGGTLLLNEIGELSLPLQAKLLTFLDTRQFTRVGGERSISVHARLIAATNRDLEKDVTNNRFRQDLFYRLNVINIVVPPLREREEDIPMIAEEITLRLATEMQLTHVPIFDERIMAALKRYSWPGNVRELRNVLERGLILWDGGEIQFNLPVREGEKRDWSYTVSFPNSGGLRSVIDEVTESLCAEALKRCQGNKKETASLLGIARDSLYRYLKQFRIESEI